MFGITKKRKVNIKIKTLWVKRQFLRQILDGKKTIEVRVGYRNIQELKPGMRLLLNEKYEVGIKNVRRYPTFSEMLEHEEAECQEIKFSGC